MNKLIKSFLICAIFISNASFALEIELPRIVCTSDSVMNIKIHNKYKEKYYLAIGVDKLLMSDNGDTELYWESFYGDLNNRKRFPKIKMLLIINPGDTKTVIWNLKDQEIKEDFKKGKYRVKILQHHEPAENTTLYEEFVVNECDH